MLFASVLMWRREGEFPSPGRSCCRQAGARWCYGVTRASRTPRGQLVPVPLCLAGQAEGVARGTAWPPRLAGTLGGSWAGVSPAGAALGASPSKENKGIWDRSSWSLFGSKCSRRDAAGGFAFVKKGGFCEVGEKRNSHLVRRRAHKVPLSPRQECHTSQQAPPATPGGTDVGQAVITS